MNVTAKVVDLSTVTPSAGLNFGLDTNVLYWLGYSKVSSDPKALKRAAPYYKFIADAVKAKAVLHCTVLNLVEVIHLIERTECELAGMKPKEIKRYRTSQSNRDTVGKEIDVLWATASKTANLISTNLETSSIDHMLRNQRSGEIDSYDMAIAESFLAADVKMIISHDRDIATYDRDLILLTTNPVCISEARNQGQLVPWSSI